MAERNMGGDGEGAALTIGVAAAMGAAFLAVIVAVTSAFSQEGGQAAGGEEPATAFTILHTNDFHSRIEPISRFNGPCSAEDDAAGECFGGSARLASLVAERRASAGPSLLLDGGDQFQGSLFYTFYRGQAAAELMNALGYDAMTAGNHEFNNGPETLRAFAEAVSFPVLLANATVSDDPDLAGLIRPSTAIEVAGARVGLIGAAPADTGDLSSPGPNVVFSDPEAAIAREVAWLSSEGIDIIILLSHSGYDVDLRLARNVAGLDVIIGGHSHSLLSNTQSGAAGPYPTMIDGPDGAPTAVVQAGAYGRHLGELAVGFDASGTLISAKGEPILVDASVRADPALAARIAELAAPLEEIRNRVVGETAAPIDGARESCRFGECEMGNLVADAMLDRVRDQGVTIAIQNGGGLRASIDAGEVTLGEILTVLPFQNTLATMTLSGADLVAALENGVSQVEEGSGRFPQVAGLRYVWSPAGEAGSGRIISVEVNGPDGFAPIDAAADYGVVTNNFMRGGGDGYAMFAENARDAYDYGPNLEEVVAEYITARTAEGAPYAPYLDGRIAAQ